MNRLSSPYWVRRAKRANAFSLNDGHKMATATPAVVEGKPPDHERGDDVNARILATLVDLQAPMMQIKVFAAED